MTPQARLLLSSFYIAAAISVTALLPGNPPEPRKDKAIETLLDRSEKGCGDQTMTLHDMTFPPLLELQRLLRWQSRGDFYEQDWRHYLGDLLQRLPSSHLAALEERGVLVCFDPELQKDSAVLWMLQPRAVLQNTPPAPRLSVNYHPHTHLIDIVLGTAADEIASNNLEKDVTYEAVVAGNNFLYGKWSKVAPSP